MLRVEILMTLRPRLGFVAAFLIVSVSFACAGAPPVLHPTMDYTSGWIGNSLNVVTPGEDKKGQPDFSYKWVQKDGNGLAVTPDGTCYATSGWDEAGKGVGIYKDGDDLGKCQGISVGGKGIAVDDKYVYASTTTRQPKGSPMLFTIGRWHLDGTAAPLDQPATFAREPSGIASYNHALYVADYAANSIRVFDPETFAETGKIACDQPFRIAFDSKGRLWVIHRANTGEPNQPATISEYNVATGAPTGRVIDDANGATALATTPDGLLLVAGPHQQVLKIDISGAKPNVIGAVGVKDGIYADPPGEMGPGRLLGLWGVGCDAKGGIYTLGRLIDIGTGTDLRAFSTDGTQKWQLSSVGFTDCVGVDPTSDGLDVYTRSCHFVLDPSQPPGRQFTWKGYTVDPAYDDGRITDHASRSGFCWTTPIMRRLNGRLYQFENSGPYFGIFRKGPGETFIPSGIISLAPPWLLTVKTGGHEHDLDWPPQQPMVPAAPATTPATPVSTNAAPEMSKTLWLWRDTNGDGKFQTDEFQSFPDRVKEINDVADSWVDNKGDIWLAGNHNTIWRLPMRGFDAQQNPIYGWDKSVRADGPAEFKDLRRLIYDSDTDTMVLAGISAGNKTPLHWGCIGDLVICYQHWSDPAKSAIKWKLSVPQDPAKPDLFFPAMSIAGDRVYLIQRFCNRVWVFNNDDASYIGMITTTPETGTSGWCDMNHGIEAWQRKDGSAFVFTEDDYRPKIRFYIVPPKPAPNPPLPIPAPAQL
jgi:hypothetical protein